MAGACLEAFSASEQFSLLGVRELEQWQGCVSASWSTASTPLVVFVLAARFEITAPVLWYGFNECKCRST
jgi:hypothetical protein